jgi:cytochrome c
MAFGFQAKAEDFPADIKPLMTKYTCFACHKPDTRLVGPAYKDVAKKKYCCFNCEATAIKLARLPSNGAYD